MISSEEAPPEDLLSFGHTTKNITYNPDFVPQGAPPNETYDGNISDHLLFM